MKRFYIFLILFFSYFTFSQNKNSSIQNESLINYSGLQVYIELTNPKIYKQNDEIFISITIKNPTQFEKSILIANDKKFSFDFQMITMQNRPLEYKKEYIISFHRIQPIFNSLIRLYPNESYTYQVRLNDYFDIDVTGQFFIRGFFYPNLKLNNSRNDTLVSNQLTINIRPNIFTEEFIVEEKSIEEEKILFAEKRAPDEVIKYMLTARMKNEWEKFFLYIDLEKLILSNNLFKNKFIKSDFEKQREIIKEYKEYLKQNTIDEISYLPHSFKIIKTEYSEGKGKVDVIIEYKSIDYIEKKYYSYFLYKKGDIWFVDSYEVLNLGIK